MQIWQDITRVENLVLDPEKAERPAPTSVRFGLRTIKEKLRPILLSWENERKQLQKTHGFDPRWKLPEEPTENDLEKDAEQQEIARLVSEELQEADDREHTIEFDPVELTDDWEPPAGCMEGLWYVTEYVKKAPSAD